MTEKLTGCGLDTSADDGYFMHGKLPTGRSAAELGDNLCDNIDTAPYMDVVPGRGGSDGCVDVRAKREGRGPDNPQRFSDVFLLSSECPQYDICPADGVSGYRRPPGKNPDIIECSAGGDGEFRYSPAAGLYPPSHRLAGAPYRYTLPKFVCLMYPPGTSSWTVTYSVTSHTEAKYGRNFLFAGSGTSRE